MNIVFIIELKGIYRIVEYSFEMTKRIFVHYFCNKLIILDSDAMFLS